MAGTSASTITSENPTAMTPMHCRASSVLDSKLHQCSSPAQRIMTGWNESKGVLGSCGLLSLSKVAWLVCSDAQNRSHQSGLACARKAHPSDKQRCGAAASQGPGTAGSCRGDIVPICSGMKHATYHAWRKPKTLTSVRYAKPLNP